MAQSAYCKKCRREVLPGGSCPYCGGKLGTPRTLWRVKHVPVRDWISWNAPMRLALPALLLVAAGVVLAEGVTGGAAGIERLLNGAFPRVLLWILAGLALLTLLVLLLQREEVLEVALDKSGLTVRTLLPKPGPLCLLAHLRSPALVKNDALRQEFGLLVDEQKLAWRQVKRVQWWPEKSQLLLYGPFWWLRLAVPVTAESWPELSAAVTERLGRKKIRMPSGLRAPARSTAGKKKNTAQQDFFPDTDPGAYGE